MHPHGHIQPWSRSTQRAGLFPPEKFLSFAGARAGLLKGENERGMKLVKGLSLWALLSLPGMAGEDKATEAPVFTMRPIGQVRNVEGKPVTLEIEKEYIEGLGGLRGETGCKPKAVMRFAFTAVQRGGTLDCGGPPPL